MSSSFRVIFVGMNPSNAPVNRGSAWDRFMRIVSDLQRGGFFRYFSFTNVSLDPNWDKNKLPKSRLRELKKQCKGYDLVVSLGNTARDELKRAEVESFRIPHPSPRNRVWNDREMEEMVIQALEQKISAVKLQLGINR